MNPDKLYPRSNDPQTIYLKNAISNPAIQIGEYTIYNDFLNDPCNFERNNVLYHYPVNNDHLYIGKYCSIACGAKFLFNSANHSLRSLSSYPFPIFYEEWNLPVASISEAWDNKGDIIIGNDVWIGYEAVILAGVTIGDGAIIGARPSSPRTLPLTPLSAACLPNPSAAVSTKTPLLRCRTCNGGTGPNQSSASISMPSNPAILTH